MERIKLSQNRDSLLLVFREAKVSLVEYDPFNHELKTQAVRSLEKDEYKVCDGIHIYHCFCYQVRLL